MNSIAHEHFCVECGKPHKCDYPECSTLSGFQRLCSRCSYLYGWRQKHERSSLDDYSAL